MYYGTSIMDNELVYLNTLQEKTNLILDSEIFIQSLNESEDGGNWLSKIFKFIKDKIMVVINAIKKAFAFVVEKITGKRKKNKEEENKDDIDLLHLDKYELKKGTEFDEYESKNYASKASDAANLCDDVKSFEYNNIRLSSMVFVKSLNKIYQESKKYHITDQDIENAKIALYKKLEKEYSDQLKEFKNDIKFTNLEEFKEVINNPDIVWTMKISAYDIFDDSKSSIDSNGMVKRDYDWYHDGKKRIEDILGDLYENYNNIDIDPDVNDLGVKDPEELSNFKKLITFYSKLYIEAIAIVNALSLNCIKCLDLENQELEKLTKWFKSKLVLKKA